MSAQQHISMQKGWWEHPFMLALLVLAAYLPFIGHPFPPLVDLPGHVGRYAIQLDGGASPYLAQWYSFEPRLIGNLGVDLIVQWLGPKYGILPVVKWVAISIPPLTILGMILAARAVLGRVPATIGFAAMFAFAYPYNFGFLNFSLSVALALNAFALWVWLAKKGWRIAQWFIFPFIAFAIYACHTFGWGILGLMVWGYEFSLVPKDTGAWYHRLFASALRTIPLAPPVLHLALWRGDNPAGATKDLLSIDRKIINYLNSLRDRWIIADLAFLIPVTLLFVQAVRKDDFLFDRRFAWIAVFVGAAFLAMPRMVFGSDLADMRLGPVVFLLALLAVHPVSKSKNFAAIVAGIGVIVLAVRLVLVTLSGQIGAAAIESRLSLLKNLPEGSRVLQINGPPPCMNWKLPRHYHLAAFNILWNSGFTNAQWDMSGANPVTIHYPEAGFFEHDPSQITRDSNCGLPRSPHFRRSIAAFPRDAFDYLYVVDGPKVDEGYAELILEREVSGARLYRIDASQMGKERPELDFQAEFAVK